MRHWVRNLLDTVVDRSKVTSDELRDDLMRLAALIEQREPYAFLDPRLDPVADQISETTSIEELTALLHDAAEICGFSFASVFLLKQGEGAPFHTRIATSYPMTWVERYGAETYQFIDPVMARSHASDDAFLYSDLDGSLPMIEAFWKDAEAHGVGRNGLAMAFTLTGGTRLGVSLASDRDAETVARIARRSGSDALAISRMGVEAFSYLARGTQATDDRLTTAEMRFLHILVTTNDPAEAVRAMPGYGSATALQASITEKLGVASILQAVALASRNRWFDDMPYDLRDVAHSMPGLAEWQDRLTGRDDAD